MAAEFDYIVVGAGAAGCVLANRLSADSSASVLLLEAGGPARHPFYRIPVAIGALRRFTGNDWGLSSEPEPGLLGRSLRLHQGKVVGGSSAINGMVHGRGDPADYDGWGCAGWSYRDLLPYFTRAEEELPVEVPPDRHPLDAAFAAAARAAGVPPDDARLLPFNIRQGRRFTAGRAYLGAAMGRPNLTLKTGAMALRWTLGAVDYRHDGAQQRAAARREVVVACGAYQSPKFLMLSGIGPADALRTLDIAVVANLPGVGRNLQNHADASVAYRCTQPVTLHSLMRFDRIALAMVRAYLLGTGPAAAFPGAAAAFVRSTPGASRPDIELHLVRGVGLPMPHLRRRSEDAFTIRTILLRPESRGRVTLRSADPLAPLRISLGYLTASRDVATLMRGIEAAREIVGQRALDQFRGAELAPGDSDLVAWLRANAGTQGHPVGTCRMGIDGDAVVDADLKVRGVPGLRVADASVMPAIVGSHTHATTVAIAERAADLILGRATPAASTP